MDHPTPTPKHDHQHSVAHGCCGGAQKDVVKEEKAATGCGCADKPAKPATKNSSCCS